MVFKFLLMLSALSVGVYSQSMDVYKGRLVSIQADVNNTFLRVFKPLGANEKYRFEPPLEKHSVVTAGELTDERSQDALLPLLVEPALGPPYICADLNGDHRIDTKERFEFRIDKNQPQYLDAVMLLPISTPIFKVFPLRVRYYHEYSHPDFPKANRLLRQSVWAHAVGEVDIEGRVIKFLYDFDPHPPHVSTLKGLVGVDTNGDGRIDNRPFSVESSYASDDEVVMRCGNMYLSTS